MQVTVQALTHDELIKPNATSARSSEHIRQKVLETRERQFNRQGCVNAHLSAKNCESVCALGNKEQVFLSKVLIQLKLSARAFHRLLKVARTIADIQHTEQVSLPHLQQALSFKQMIHRPK